MSLKLLSKQNTSIKLIEGTEAEAEIRTKDAFITNLTTFDLQSRLFSTTEVSLEAYLDFVAKQILPWTSELQKVVQGTLEVLNKALQQEKLTQLNFPSVIKIVHTNGKEEGNAAYCRNMNVIVLPTSILKSLSLNKILAHELFHILSKNNLALQTKLYKVIGYEEIPNRKKIELPSSLKDLRITNPDAPEVCSYISLKYQSRNEVPFVPMILAGEPYHEEAAKQKVSFFDFLQPCLMELDTLSWELKQNGVVASYNDVEGFFEKVGKNSEYIIHPEELCADNFVLVVFGKRQVHSPHIVQKMFDILANEQQNI